MQKEDVALYYTYNGYTFNMSCLSAVCVFFQRALRLDGKRSDHEFQFYERRSTQATAFLIRRNGDRLNYMKLIKLLYLADRAALVQWQQPITGDTYLFLPNGPVLDMILDKISGGPNPKSQDYWSDSIGKSLNDPYAVTAKDSLGYDELSTRELSLLEAIDEKFKGFSQWDMVEYCCQSLPELNKGNRSFGPKTIQDIVKASSEESF